MFLSIIMLNVHPMSLKSLNKTVLPKVFLILLLSVIFFQNFESMDKRGIQWVYLSVLSLFSFILNPSLYSFHTIRSNFGLLLYFVFFIISFSSIFYAKNFTLSLVDISHIFVVFTLLVHSFNLFKTISFSFFIKVISFFALIEVFFIFYPLIKSVFIYNDLFFDRNLISMTGLTGNKNIAAASFAFKLPFVIAYLFSNKNGLKKALISTLIFLLLLASFLISSRASFISLFFIISISIIYLFYNRFYKDILFLSSSFLTALSVSYLFLSNSNLDVASRVSSIGFTDESSSGRIELWSNALDYISNNFFIGCGIGNWKIESMPYWKTRLSEYTVPYHAHNDFLEIFTELGIFGFIIFVLIFIYTFINIYKKIDFNSPYIVIFGLAFFAFFIDSFFNFPLERPISMVLFIISFSFINSYEAIKNESI